MAANKTMDVDKLFVRDIYFKDYSNRPISANKILTTRGDGGIFFGSAAPASLFPGFNDFRAGSNAIITASNTDQKNTLWLEEGAGIEFTQILDGLQPKTYISATAPEQIVLRGQGRGGTLHFSSLQDEFIGGRTMYFDGRGDILLSVSDSTLIFDTAYNSSYSSLTALTSTTEGLINNASTIQSEIYDTLSTVNTVLISSAISTFYSTLMYAVNGVNDLSSFVYSTFNVGIDGSSHLTVGTLNAVEITADVMSTTCLIADTIKVGSNVMQSYALVDSNSDICTAFLSSGTLSTYTEYMVIQNDYTNTRYGYETSFMFENSTFHNSTFQTLGAQTQYGFLPTLSTQGGRLPPNIRDQYIPIIQQTEILEQVLVSTPGAITSTIKNYKIKNVGKFDEVCASGDTVVFTAQNVQMVTLTVSTINSILPFYAPFISTFSTIFISTGWVEELRISTARISTMSSYQLTGTYGFIRDLSTITQNASTIRYSTLTGNIISTQSAVVSSGTINTLASQSISTTNLSTAWLSFRTAQGTTVSTTNTYTSALVATNASTTSLSTNALQYIVGSGSNFTASTLGFGNANGTTISTVYLSAGTMLFGQGSGTSLSTNSLAFINGTGSNLSASSFTYNVAAGQTISTVYLSTAQLAFSSATGQSLVASNIGFNVASGNSISTTNLSTAGLAFLSASGSNINTSSIAFVTASGNSISTTNLSTGGLAFSSGAGNSLATNTLQFSTASGLSLSTQYISTNGLVFGSAGGVALTTSSVGFSSATGNVMVANSIGTSSLQTSTLSALAIQTDSLSTQYISSLAASIQAIETSSLVGSTAALLTLSTGGLGFEGAAGSSITINYAGANSAYISDLTVSSLKGVDVISTYSTLYWSTAVGLNATVSTLRVSTIMGTDLPIFTFDMENRRVGLNLGATQQPRATMDISGILFANNVVTTSDRRLKSEIHLLELPHMIPNGYRYKQDETGEYDIGIMADEIEQIAPECVFTRSDGYKAVSYMKLVPVCLTLIRSLSDRLSALEADRN